MKRNRAQYLEKTRRNTLELGQRAEIPDLIVGEGELLEIFDHLLEAGRQNEIPVAGQLAEEQLEGGDLVCFAGLEITSRHSELVEVGEESGHWNGAEGPRHFFLGGWASLTSEAALDSSSTVFESTP